MSDSLQLAPGLLSPLGNVLPPRLEAHRHRVRHATRKASELVADVHKSVVIIEVRTVRHQDQLRAVDAGAAAILGVHIHGIAGAIGRFDKDSTEPIAHISADTRWSNQTARAGFSSQTSGANGTIDARDPARSRVAAESAWPDSTYRAHFAIKPWETSGSAPAARTR